MGAVSLWLVVWGAGARRRRLPSFWRRGLGIYSLRCWPRERRGWRPYARHDGFHQPCVRRRGSFAACPSGYLAAYQSGYFAAYSWGSAPYQLYASHSGPAWTPRPKRRPPRRVTAIPPPGPHRSARRRRGAATGLAVPADAAAPASPAPDGAADRPAWPRAPVRRR